MASIIYGIFGISITGYFLTLLSSNILSGISRCESLLGCRDDDDDIAADSTSGRLWTSVILLILWLGGGLIYSYMEGWSYLTAIYFLFVSFSTVGFGDYVPEKQAARIFTMFYLLFGLASATIVLGAIGEEFARDMENYVMEVCFGAKEDEEFVLTTAPRVRSKVPNSTCEFEESAGDVRVDL